MSPESTLFELILERINLDTGAGGLREVDGDSAVCDVVRDGDASSDPKCDPLLAISVDSVRSDSFSKDGVLCIVRFILITDATEGQARIGSITGRIRDRFHRALLLSGGGWEWSAMSVSRTANAVRRRNKSIVMVDGSIIGRRI